MPEHDGLDWDALAPPHAWRFERNGRSQLLRPGRLRMVANNAEALLAGALAGLGIDDLRAEPEAVFETMMCLIKTAEDKSRMTREVSDRLLGKVA